MSQQTPPAGEPPVPATRAAFLQRYKEELANVKSKSRLLQDLQALLDEAERRKYKTKRFFAVMGAYDSIKSFTADQAAAVTTEYLENPRFKQDVSAFVESPEIRKAVEGLLRETVVSLCHDLEVQREVRGLFVRMMQDDEIRAQAQELAADKMTRLLQDDKVQEAAGDAAWGAMLRVLGRKT